MTLRSAFFWLHLLVGVLCGAVIFLMSATGVLLTFEKQLVAWADRDVRATPVGERMPLSDLETVVRSWNPEFQPTSIVIRPDPASPIMLRANRLDRLYVDAYSGRILGSGNESLRLFFATMVNWHRWLGAVGDDRAIGRAITGAANLAFLSIILSGCYLWWPRSWNWSRLRSVVWFRMGLQGRARDFNWHNVIGLWTAVVLIVLVGSGAVISYRWAGDLVYVVAGDSPPSRSSSTRLVAPVSDRTEATAAGGWTDLDRVYAGTIAIATGWRTVSIPLTRPREPSVTVTVDSGTGGQPQKRERFVLSRASGEVIERIEFVDGTRGSRLRSILRFAHTGELLGLPGQAVAGLASLAACVLVWTGFALAWRRLVTWRVTQRGPKSQNEDGQTDLAA